MDKIKYVLGCWSDGVVLLMSDDIKELHAFKTRNNLPDRFCIYTAKEWYRRVIS